MLTSHTVISSRANYNCRCLRINNGYSSGTNEIIEVLAITFNVESSSIIGFVPSFNMYMTEHLKYIIQLAFLISKQFNSMVYLVLNHNRSPLRALYFYTISFYRIAQNPRVHTFVFVRLVLMGHSLRRMTGSTVTDGNSCHKAHHSESGETQTLFQSVRKVHIRPLSVDGRRRPVRVKRKCIIRLICCTQGICLPLRLFDLD